MEIGGGQLGGGVHGLSPEMSLKPQEPRKLVSEDKGRWTSQLKQKEFTLPQPFCFIQALHRLNDAHLH